MTAKTLRAALSARITSNADSALKALNNANVSLTKEEEANLKAGNLEGFSDQQLSERFNAKVLGILGVSTSDFASSSSASHSSGYGSSSSSRQAGSSSSNSSNNSGSSRNDDSNKNS